MASHSTDINKFHTAKDNTHIRYVESEQQHALFDSNDFEHFTFDLVEPDFLKANDLLVGTSAGRGTVWFLRNPQSHVRCEYVLRAYLRGGFIRHFLHDQYFDLHYQYSRAWREFKLLQWMVQVGLPVPRPVVAVVKRTGVVSRSFLMTERIPGAKDLHECISEGPLPAEIWRRIGRVIAIFHRHQVYHHDLNLRNIMLDEAEQPWLIDFDKGQLKKTGNWTSSNIDRLKRSFVKAKTMQPTLFWEANDFELLLEGYDSDAETLEPFISQQR